MRGACDCHVHILQPSRFPFATDRAYTPGTADIGSLRALHGRLGFERCVVVQPSVYGAENSCLVDALETLGPAARGIAVLGTTPDGDEMERLHAAGVRGIRLNFGAEFGDATQAAATLVAAMRAVEGRGWHVEMLAPFWLNHAILRTLPRSATAIVLDHFAGLTLNAALPDRAQIEGLFTHDNVYVKLSAANRIVRSPEDHDALATITRMMMASAPRRLVFGTDWPHTSRSKSPTLMPSIDRFSPVDDGAELRRLAQWVGSEELLRQIFVETPARLYDFDALPPGDGADGR
jgi:predicted TIM-barrel fold metal-dependent hydrolase